MIYIPGNVPSAKNTKRIYGRRLVDSKLTMDYKSNTGIIYKMKKGEFHKMIDGLEPPFHVAFQFIRDSKRRFDFHNAIHVVADLMVDYGWMEDDNADVFVPVFLPYEYKKNDGGVKIYVLDGTKVLPSS